MRISDWSSDVCSSDLQAAQLAMEEQQIHPIPGLVDTQAPLPPDEGEAFTQLQQEVFQPLNQGRFQVGFRILVLEVEELQHIRSEEHTSELKSLMRTSYAVFCLKKKTVKKRLTSQIY